MTDSCLQGTKTGMLDAGLQAPCKRACVALLCSVVWCSVVVCGATCHALLHFALQLIVEHFSCVLLRLNSCMDFVEFASAVVVSEMAVDFSSSAFKQKRAVCPRTYTWNATTHTPILRREAARVDVGADGLCRLGVSDVRQTRWAQEGLFRRRTGECSVRYCFSWGFFPFFYDSVLFH